MRVRCWLFALAWAAEVSAEGYGEPHPRGVERDRDTPTLSIGVEGLFGFSSLTRTAAGQDAFGMDTQIKTKSSVFSLFGGGTGNVYTVPRLALDFWLSSRLTLGAALHTALGTVVDPDPQSDVERDVRASSFSPRLGVLFGTTPVAFWPRIGLSFFSESQKSGELTIESSGSAFTLEFPLLIRNANFGVSVGPSFYIPTAGKTKIDPEGGDSTTTQGETSGWAVPVSGFVLF